VFIDPDLRAMIAARFEFVGTEINPGVPDTVAGRAAARSSALRHFRPVRPCRYRRGSQEEVGHEGPQRRNATRAADRGSSRHGCARCHDAPALIGT